MNRFRTVAWSRWGLAVLVVALCPVPTPAQVDGQMEILRANVEEIRFSEDPRVQNARIASQALLPDLYERRGFRLAWTDPEAIDQLLAAIRDSAADGLLPEDYHLEDLTRLRARARESGSPGPELLADLDILLTDALIRLGYHVVFGKVDPEDLIADWNLAREIDDADPVEVILEGIESNNIRKTIESRKPQHPIYRSLKDALARYRAIQEAGGWEPVPSGPALKQGSQGRRVALLRRRLAATGDLTGTSADPERFDASLEAAVKRFQARHRLGADGIAGRNTLKAMNVPVQDRIDQLRVNLERARWILQEVEAREEFVITDIAAFEVMFVKDGAIAWEARAQVGKEFRKTPTFKSDIKYLVFNPTWTIPPGFLSKDVLPAVKRDPGYLAERNIRVLDRDGKEIDRESIYWSKYPGRGFPYVLRQDPGPTNALGLVKFIFPNPHFVYLHDTPSKSLFERRQRTFSSGCIRVERPFELAELLLDDPGKWNRAAIDAVIESGEMRTVFLREPMPVLLLYWTVRTRDGLVVFKEDIYGRDEAVLEALNGEFKVRGRGVLGGGKL